ncbi:alpha/beta hydrolase [Leifsonia xyli]|uniref:alpha/beta hydrolase n=1 Tax=Leifsonia xyli TaxID=1575 RepID=UPI003D6640DC
MRSRVRDWSPVEFHDDPTPGNVDVVAELMDDLRARGLWFTSVSALLNQVRGQVQAPTWSGLAGQVFCARLAALQARSDKASARNREAGDACQRWAEAMFHTQFLADRALRTAEEAQEEIRAAESSIQALTGSYDQALAVVEGMMGLLRTYAHTAPPPKTQLPSPVAVAAARRRAESIEDDRDRAVRTLAEAQERLEHARAEARAAHDEFTQAEARFVAALEHATAASPDSLFDDLQDFTSAVATLTTIEKITGTTAATTMSLLNRLPLDQLTALLADDPALAQQFWDHPPSPEAVSGWWARLGATMRAAYIKAVPGIVGNLPGVPYKDRNVANLNSLNAAAKSPNLTDAQRKVLDAMGKALDAPAKGVPVQLVAFNFFTEPPMLAVGYGDLDNCAPTTWCVGGMAFGAKDALLDWSQAGKNLWNAQKQLDRDSSPGVVACFEYDNPDAASVNFSDSAKKGAARFAAELDGNAEVRNGFFTPYSPISVTAHSYGTTMASIALTRVKTKIDSLVMVGSAGIDTAVVPSVSAIRAAHVYTTAATPDRLAPVGAAFSGRANPNPGVTLPTGESIGGAQAFSSDGDGKKLEPVDGHNPIGKKGGSPNPLNGNAEPSEGHGYYDLNTQSLNNMAAVTTGHLERLSGALTDTGTQAAEHNRQVQEDLERLSRDVGLGR